MNEIKTNTPRFKRALKKAIETKPKVRIGKKPAQYFVDGSTGNIHVVTFQRGGGGRLLWSCLCPAGQSGNICYCAAAALLAHSAFVRAGLRQPAARREISPQAWRGSDEMRAYV